jgi:8-amino-7-oxononanoate synthase
VIISRFANWIDKGLLVPGIRPPTVPQGEALLRISLSCAHTRDDLQRLLAVLGEVKEL